MSQFDDHILRRLEPQITRLRLLHAGYAPVPANGKRPAIAGYPAFATKPPTADTVEGWTHTRPKARSTGIICGATRVIDIDVDDRKRAAVCRHVVESVVGGELPCRVGRWPRLALFARSDDPNRGTLREICRKGAVEILGRGTHVVVDGRHPDTGRPYYWPFKPLWEISAKNLPILTAAHEATILRRIGRLLGGKRVLLTTLPPHAARHAAAGPGLIAKGQRNDALFRLIKDQAPSCDTQAELLKWAMAQNAKLCTNPLGAREIGQTVKQVWKYKVDGKLLVSGHEATAMIRRSEFDRLKGDTDALALYVGLQLAHRATGLPFAVTSAAMSKAKSVGMTEKRITRACRNLVAKGFLQRVGGRGVLGDPVMYRFVR